MIRLLIFLAFAAAPLAAGAHGGHHSTDVAETAVVPAAERVVVAVAAAAHCPTGGGQELCSCHGLSCTPSFQPIAIAAAPSREVAIVRPTGLFPHIAVAAFRSWALLGFSPRGPPPLS
ncbi:MAG TPA: hypothetical protein VM183_20290 [Burkholderiales bacterium]|nr:hypothetical protein [Burkholderiales bacterium]